MPPEQERAFALSIAKSLLRFFTPRFLSSTSCSPTMAEPDPIPHMRTALSMAEHALQTNETPVGCILLHPTHSLISTGQNATNRTYNGTMHAEFIAINSFLSPPPSSPFASLALQERLKILQESTLYVTVEPCIMCASLLRQFGISKVFFGCSNEKFGGNGGVLDIHVSNGRFTEVDREGKDRVKKGEKEEGDYEVSGGWLREEAILMLRRFYVQENGRAPEPRTKRERVLKTEVESLEERKKREELARIELKKEQAKKEQAKREEKKAEQLKIAQAKAEQMKAEQAKAKQKVEQKRQPENTNWRPRRASSASSSSSNGRRRGDDRRVFGDRANGQWERRGSQEKRPGSQEKRSGSQEKRRNGRVAWSGPSESKILELKEAMDTSIIPASKQNRRLEAK